MKYIYMMLAMVGCVQGVRAMQAEVKMRESASRAELEEREVLRVEIKRAYDILRREINKFDALPQARQEAARKEYLSAVHERLEDIEYLEGLAKEQYSDLANHHHDFLDKFKRELESGVKIELFEAVAQTSIIARVAFERRRQLIHQRLAAQMDQAAAAQEARQGERDERNSSGITDDDLIEAGFALLVGKASWMLVRQGGKWALKGANPWVAGALTVAELYKLGCYIKSRNKS
jgi:hypothetical protein